MQLASVFTGGSQTMAKEKPIRFGLLDYVDCIINESGWHGMSGRFILWHSGENKDINVQFKYNRKADSIEVSGALPSVADYFKEAWLHDAQVEWRELIDPLKDMN